MANISKRRSGVGVYRGAQEFQGTIILRRRSDLIHEPLLDGGKNFYATFSVICLSVILRLELRSVIYGDGYRCIITQHCSLHLSLKF